MDLSGFAGQRVEVSITALSDRGLQQFPGVFIDDIVVSTGEGTASFEVDGNQLDGWTVPGAPQNANGIEGVCPAPGAAFEADLQRRRVVAGTRFAAQM